MFCPLIHTFSSSICKAADISSSFACFFDLHRIRPPSDSDQRQLVSCATNSQPPLSLRNPGVL